jgi:transcriptional regulator with XRE-family HTH domain
LNWQGTPESSAFFLRKMTVANKGGDNRFKKLRLKLGLNQQEFWSRLGVTQSGGSRYESGRRVPEPIKKLIELAYGNNALLALKRLRA